eukprot:scaffold99903_cov26-Tisochrysis_lutea.AAC.2
MRCRIQVDASRAGAPGPPKGPKALLLQKRASCPLCPPPTFEKRASSEAELAASALLSPGKGYPS